MKPAGEGPENDDEIKKATHLHVSMQVSVLSTTKN